MVGGAVPAFAVAISGIRSVEDDRCCDFDVREGSSVRGRAVAGSVRTDGKLHSSLHATDIGLTV